MGPPELCGACQWLVGFLELSRSKRCPKPSIATLEPNIHYGSGRPRPAKTLGGSRGLGRKGAEILNARLRWVGVQPVVQDREEKRSACVLGGPSKVGGFQKVRKSVRSLLASERPSQNPARVEGL